MRKLSKVSKLPLLQESQNLLFSLTTVLPEMKRRGDPIKFICVLVSTVFAFVLCLSVLKLDEIPVGTSNAINSSGVKKLKVNPIAAGGIGKLGEVVIGMLPQDLGFTLFLTSEKAFERDLGLGPNDLVGENGNDTYAILTRLMGFSVVLRAINSDDVQLGKEIDYDSISGYILYISEDSDGSLFVNRVASEMVDLRRGKIIVHVMDGVIMDPEFEQSVRPGSEEDN